MTVTNGTAVDIDEEHTRLLTYRRAAAAASERIQVLAALLDGLVPVLVLPASAAEGDAASSSLLEAIAAASTAEMMNQASFRAALGTLVSPVQRSLVAFVA